MAELKKILVSLPDSLLREVDEIVAMGKKNRSEFIREAMKLYLQERRKRQIRERMQEGYREMAGLNLSLAKEAFEAENEASRIVEELVAGE